MIAEEKIPAYQLAHRGYSSVRLVSISVNLNSVRVPSLVPTVRLQRLHAPLGAMTESRTRAWTARHESCPRDLRADLLLYSRWNLRKLHQPVARLKECPSARCENRNIAIKKIRYGELARRVATFNAQNWNDMSLNLLRKTVWPAASQLTHFLLKFSVNCGLFQVSRHLLTVIASSKSSCCLNGFRDVKMLTKCLYWWN